MQTVLEKTIKHKKKCRDCKMCQMCSESRCKACLNSGCKRNKKLSIREQIELFERINAEAGKSDCGVAVDRQDQHLPIELLTL
jgi:hypothetical protein